MLRVTLSHSQSLSVPSSCPRQNSTTTRDQHLAQSRLAWPVTFARLKRQEGDVSLRTDWDNWAYFSPWLKSAQRENWDLAKSRVFVIVVGGGATLNFPLSTLRLCFHHNFLSRCPYTKTEYIYYMYRSFPPLRTHHSTLRCPLYTAIELSWTQSIQQRLNIAISRVFTLVSEPLSPLSPTSLLISRCRRVGSAWIRHLFVIEQTYPWGARCLQYETATTWALVIEGVLRSGV